MDREAVEGRPMYVDRYVVKEKQKPATKDFKVRRKGNLWKIFMYMLRNLVT